MSPPISKKAPPSLPPHPIQTGSAKSSTPQQKTAPTPIASDTNARAAAALIAEGTSAASLPMGKKTRTLIDAGTGVAESTVATSFAINREIDDTFEVRVPLPTGVLHLIEVEYQDIRKLGDLQFGYRRAGQTGDVTFRGSDFRLPDWPQDQPIPADARLEGTTLVGNWFTALALEQQGMIAIRREPIHNGPWVYNAIYVQVDVLYPDGKVHEVGKKFVDFHVHDAGSIDGSGSREIDNISNGFERLPQKPLPAGCVLRLRPIREKRAPWETSDAMPLQLAWVKPQRLPPFNERKTAFSAADFQHPPSSGYKVDPGRPIAALLITWTDYKESLSGYVHFTDKSGAVVQTPASNIGSGETELVPLDGAIPKEGVIHVSGGGTIGVKRIDVLYAK